MKSLSVNPPIRGELPTALIGRPAKTGRTEFGQRILSARQELGLTQAQVAEHLGITQQSFAGWERRQTALRPEHLRQLARILNVTVDFLLGDQPSVRRGTGLSGEIRRAFDQVCGLPRHQQQRIATIIKALVAEASRRRRSASPVLNAARCVRAGGSACVRPSGR